MCFLLSIISSGRNEPVTSHFFAFMWFPAENLYFCFQIINYSCGLDSLMVYLAAGCVILISRIKSISAASSSMVYLWISWKRKCVFQFSIALPLDIVLPSTRQRLLCEAQETEVPSLLTKVALVAECDRMWILLEHCVCRRWQRTWDLIKIYLEGDHSSTRPNLEKWLSSTWQT